MNTLKKEMIKKAKIRFKKILPCGSKRKFAECFTIERDRVFFWFNTKDHSTHVLYSEL